MAVFMPFTECQKRPPVTDLETSRPFQSKMITQILRNQQLPMADEISHNYNISTLPFLEPTFLISFFHVSF